MQAQDMNRLIEAHLDAESSGDTTGCVAMYTNKVEHDVVGAPHGPLHGRDAAKTFYEHPGAGHLDRTNDPDAYLLREDFCVMDTGGTVACLVRFSEFQEGLMSRENVWLDGSSIAQQPTAPETRSNQRQSTFA
jgi:hypothetical protein